MRTLRREDAVDCAFAEIKHCSDCPKSLLLHKRLALVCQAADQRDQPNTH
jgi:hypothetical protein